MNEPTLRIHEPGKPTSRTFGPLTVAQVVTWYQSNHIRAGASADGERERSRVRGLFVDALGERLTDDCTPADLLQFINSQPGVSSAWTRRRWAATLNAPFNFARKAKIISANPFAGIPYPEGDEGRDWTDNEYQAALRHARPAMRRLIVFMRYSGCRPGEARALLWVWVRVDADAIMLETHKMRWKTRAARRVPFNAVIVKLLAWLRRHNVHGAKNVFRNSYGKPWTRRATDRAVERIRAAGGLADDFVLHGCRHKFATCAVVNGVDVATLAQLLGHGSTNTTRRYVHLAGKVPHLNAAMEQAVRGRG